MIDYTTRKDKTIDLSEEEVLVNNPSVGTVTVRYPKQVRILTKFCWRKLRWAPMVLWPQQVSWYGKAYHGDYGDAECTACGKKHWAYQLRGLVTGT